MTELPGRLVLLGHPVSHSLSPALQNAALRAAEIPLRYDTIDLMGEELAQAVVELKAARAAGNVTVPHKEAFGRLCDRVTEQASVVGAVNAFAVRGEDLVGHNTDVDGFAASLHALDPGWDGKTIGLIGAGGAAAAVLAVLTRGSSDRPIFVINRDRKRAESLAARFGSRVAVSDAATIAREAQIVINATSLGLRPDDPTPIDPARLAPGTAVLDLVYASGETEFVRAARASGHRAMDGLRMLVEQGAAAFGWWFHRPPDREVMWAATGRPMPRD